MTRSSRLLQIIAIALLLAYTGAMIYDLYWLDAVSRPVHSLPLVFCLLIMSILFFALAPLVFSQRIAGMWYRRPTTERDKILRVFKRDHILWLMGGVCLLFLAIVQG